MCLTCSGNKSCPSPPLSFSLILPMSHIFLYGPPGTGKSTIGRKLARHLSLPFVDLDRVIETKAGMSIPQIMEQQGEPAFRDLESSALGETVGHPSGVTSHVIALGGGALLRDE